MMLPSETLQNELGHIIPNSYQEVLAGVEPLWLSWLVATPNLIFFMSYCGKKCRKPPDRDWREQLRPVETKRSQIMKSADTVSHWAWQLPGLSAVVIVHHSSTSVNPCNPCWSCRGGANEFSWSCSAKYKSLCLTLRWTANLWIQFSERLIRSVARFEIGATRAYESWTIAFELATRRN